MLYEKFDNKRNMIDETWVSELFLRSLFVIFVFFSVQDKDRGIAGIN